MLFNILQAHGGTLPDNAVVCFANTGKEREETLVFVQRCADEWGVEIHWLEYDRDDSAKGGVKDPKTIARRVDFDSASRNGEPFMAMINGKHILPNVTMRSCTAEMKALTVERYMRRAIGQKRFRNVIGIRYDEPKRWLKTTEDCMIDHPMHEAGVTKKHVADFWSAQNFDLGIESWQGNCDLCFLKGRKNLLHSIRQEPERAQWWIDTEESASRFAKERKMRFHGHRFRLDYTYKDLVKVVNIQPELGLEPVDDLEGIDCFCGD